MAWFRKETSTHIVRDQKGNIVHIEREGEQQESKYDVYARRRQQNREIRQRERQEKRYEKKYQQQREKEAYRKAYNEERVKIKSEQGHRTARKRWAPPIRPRRVVYQKRKPRTRKHKGKKPVNPWDMQKRMMRPGWRF